MPKRSEIPVCILAGGASRRFGSHKAFADLGGKPLLMHVIERIMRQTNGPVLINANDADAFNVFGLPIISDGTWAGSGPLSGIAVALQWAADAVYNQIATLAVDQPFLPRSYLATLLQAGAVDPFLNVNTQADLADATQLLHKTNVSEAHIHRLRRCAPRSANSRPLMCPQTAST